MKSNFSEVHKHTGRTCTDKHQREWLNFSGTAFLGASYHPQFTQCVKEAIDLYGSGFGSSRLSPGSLEIYNEAEIFLAELLGTEKALLLSSGALAGQLLVQQLQEKYSLAAAPGTHPAMLSSGVQIGSFEQIYEQWWQELTEVKSQSVLTDSFNYLHCEMYPFQQLPLHKTELLVVDDSHGIGLFGSGGCGIAEHLQQLEVPWVVSSSMNKAWGVAAGVVAGSAELINQLLLHPLVRGSSPPAPAGIYAFMQAQKYYQQQREQLAKNVAFILHNWPEALPNQTVLPYPVIYVPQKKGLDTAALAQHLNSKGVMITAFPYPLPTSEPLCRIVISSLHTQSDLEQLLAAIHSFTA
jgi:7-keto-8-aminopelargonate synthetase-like enzyme